MIVDTGAGLEFHVLPARHNDLTGAAEEAGVERVKGIGPSF
ncbi:MAG TPA: hypothetical protein VIH50_00750 [Steroidobacteraceae bacterium]|jgi:hypothetical protein